MLHPPALQAPRSQPGRPPPDARASSDRVPAPLPCSRRIGLTSLITLASVPPPTASAGPLPDSFVDQLVASPQQGPLQPVSLPRLEHVCTSCLTVCAGSNCLIRLFLTYPRRGAAWGLRPPYPLAIITSGFLLAAEAYKPYSDLLASWGYTALRYDKVETVTDFLDDTTSVAVLRQLMDWAATDPLVRRVADTSRVYLVGHSRGAKLSCLAAVEDRRVAALCLLDPVDNTVFAPIAPGFPSALAALAATASPQPPAPPHPTPDGPPPPAPCQARDASQAVRGQGGAATNSPGLELQGNGPGASGLNMWAARAGPAAGLLPSSPPPSAPSPSAAAAATLPTTSSHAQPDGFAMVPGPGPLPTSPRCPAPAAADSVVPEPGYRNVRVPIAIVGSGLGGDCAPQASNHTQFYRAAQGPAWEVTVPEAGEGPVGDPVQGPLGVQEGGVGWLVVRFVYSRR
ncbi:hypothetical protein V8C86DRAFT_2455374 [Haematococcus lacustris]